jgi:alkanesulfonate monooxygenase SsuD/methylene tetrahydromethanopterin reductase-like flavin-dependent oxidoreductase (luciferase family)
MRTSTLPIHPWVAESTGHMRFGVEFAPLPDWGATRDFAQAAEALGFDSLWIPDHPGVLGNATWTTLAALATATSTIRLGPLVACAAYGNPVILARAAADVDRLSGGRLVLGLGSGDMPHEFAQLGIAWGTAVARQARLEETLRVVRPLLRGETVSFAGEYVRAEGAVLDPPPVQQPSVPILVAGGGERTTLRFVAEYADACNLGAVGWAGGAYTAADIARKLGILDAHCGEAGRPAEAVLRTGLALAVVGESAEAARAKRDVIPAPFLEFFGQLPLVASPEEMVAQVHDFRAAGFQYLIFIVFDVETLQLLGERVLPAVGAV